MDFFITLCPQCNTGFRVSEAQLQAADGHVRCGACLTVFRAEEHIVTSPAEDSPDLEETPVEETAREESSDTFSTGTVVPEPAWELIEEPALTSAALINEDPDGGTADPDQQDEFYDNAGPQLFAGGAAGFHADLYDDDLPDRFDESHRTALGRVAPTLVLDMDDTRLSPGRFVAGIALALLLVALIPVQYVWFNRSALAEDDAWRLRFAALCALLPCELPPQRDIGAIISDSLSVRTHPTEPAALVVNLNFRNQASFAQPFPLLTLRFTDAQQQLVAIRSFRPQEYLSGDLRQQRDMPAGASVQASLEIVDPGPEAINYEVFLRAH
jgi:predicted Zn finger-like uncharacterized protein